MLGDVGQPNKVARRRPELTLNEVVVDRDPRPSLVGAEGPVVQSAGMTASALVDKVVKSDPMRRWRVEELERAGYHPYDALVLSRRPAR